MNFPQINPGDAKCILLTAAVSFAVGVVLTFSVMTIMSADGGGKKISQVRYEHGGLECSDGIHRGNVEPSGGNHADNARHKTLCDEMRRIAKEIAQTAVEEHHPKAVE